MKSIRIPLAARLTRQNLAILAAKWNLDLLIPYYGEDAEDFLHTVLDLEGVAGYYYTELPLRFNGERYTIQNE